MWFFPFLAVLLGVIYAVLHGVLHRALRREAERMLRYREKEILPGSHDKSSFIHAYCRHHFPRGLRYVLLTSALLALCMPFLFLLTAQFLLRYAAFRDASLAQGWGMFVADLRERGWNLLRSEPNAMYFTISNLFDGSIGMVAAFGIVFCSLMVVAAAACLYHIRARPAFDSWLKAQGQPPGLQTGGASGSWIKRRLQ